MNIFSKSRKCFICRKQWNYWPV